MSPSGICYRHAKINFNLRSYSETFLLALASRTNGELFGVLLPLDRGVKEAPRAVTVRTPWIPSEDDPMRLHILSRQESLYSTRRLVEAAVERGHVVEVCDTLRFDICLTKDHAPLYYGSAPVGRVDAVIPRIGASITFFGLAVL